MVVLFLLVTATVRLGSLVGAAPVALDDGAVDVVAVFAFVVVLVVQMGY